MSDLTKQELEQIRKVREQLRKMKVVTPPTLYYDPEGDKVKSITGPDPEEDV